MRRGVRGPAHIQNIPQMIISLMFTDSASKTNVRYAEGMMSWCDYGSEGRHAVDLPVPPSFSSCGASIIGQNGTCGSGAQVVANPAPEHAGYLTDVFMRRQEVLSQIASQHSRPSLSADEHDYLSRMSSTISTLNVESVASIDVLKLCIVCSRFYPRIDIRGELALLKSGIEAFLSVKAI
jgi:hypothetical protein